MITIKRNRPFFFLGLLCCLFLPACFSPGQGSLSEENRTELNNFAAKSVSVEKKYIKMMEKMVLLLEEVNAMGDPQLAMDRLRKFYADDQYALKQISREINGWYKFASEEDISTFLVAVNEDSASYRLRKLVPLTRQKIDYNLEWEQEFNLLISYLKLEH